MAARGASSLAFGLTDATSKVRINVTRKHRRLAARTNTAKIKKDEGSRVNTVARSVIMQELDSLLPDFHRWYRQHEGKNDFRLVLEQLTGFHKVYALSIRRPTTVTAMDPEWLLEMMAALFVVHQKCAVLVATTLYDFLRFLRDSERWSGSQAAYLEARAVLRAAIFEDVISPFRLAGESVK